MSDCIFCKIISREIPADVVYEDELIFAFMDAMPVQKGHVLVIPKAHSENALHVTEADIAKLMAVVQMLVPKVQTATGATGANITTNIGTAAGQSIFHTHFHIIPRFHDDTALTYTHVSYADESERKKIAEKIKSA